MFRHEASLGLRKLAGFSGHVAHQKTAKPRCCSGLRGRPVECRQAVRTGVWGPACARMPTEPSQFSSGDIPEGGGIPSPQRLWAHRLLDVVSCAD